MSKYEAYETVIGLEIHVQLSTKSKAFCSDSTLFGQAPNTQTSVVSLAHPGTLPRLNKQQVAFAVRLGLALGCHINLTNTFDRKNYFYADLPKGYQITQDKLPICVGGGLTIQTAQGPKYVALHHIHMEEDAGKSIHDQDPNATLVDLNRAGTPLLEIVTMPELNNGEEVDAFMSAMRHLVRWLDISDGNMEEGSMRCDVNISVRPKGTTAFGTRCEVKNVNSMRFARRAIEFEHKRQIDILEKGGTIHQQTLNFDPQTGVTTPLRSKENANDYRYFPDPDLPPLVLSPAFIAQIEAEMPILPVKAQEALMANQGLSLYDAQLLTEEKNVYLYFQNTIAHVPPPQYKAVANLMINKILPYVHETKTALAAFPLSSTQIRAFIDLIDSGKVSHSVAYQTLWPALLDQPEADATALATALNLFQNTDTDFLAQVVKEVVAQYPEKVAEYKKGKKGLIGFFMGEVMKASKGKAEPKSTNALLAAELEA